MTKGISTLVISIFLVLISISLAYGFFVFGRTTQETVQEEIGKGTERELGKLGAGLKIVAVADNQVSVQNTGKSVMETSKIDVFLDGRRATTSADVETIGPSEVAVINVTNFVPGVRRIRVSGPFESADETVEPLLYPGTVAFWDFMPEDEGFPQDYSAGDNTGRLNGTTVLAMHMDESRGDIAPDASGYENDGALVNGPRWTNGIARNGLEFDGDDDYVSIPDTPSTSIIGALTLEAWIKSTSTANNEFIVGKDDTNQRAYMLMIHTNKLALNILQTADGSVEQLLQDPVENRVRDGKWHHVAGVFIPSARMTLYVDGEEVATTTTGVPSSIFDSSAELTIGRRPFSGSNIPLKGTLDEVAVHSRALSEAEIKQHFEAKRALFSDYVKGMFNSALALNGNNSHVDVPASSSLNLFAQMTLEAWVNMRGGRTVNDTIVRKEGSYALWINATGDRPGGRVWVQGGAPVDAREASPITRSDWHHIVLTADGTWLRLYTDGQLSRSTGYDGQIPFTDSSLFIGTGTTEYVNGVLNGAFNGTFDYVALYKVALTADEIRSIYDAATK